VPLEHVISRITDTSTIPAIALSAAALGIHLVKLVLDRLLMIQAVRSARGISELVQIAVEVTIAKESTPSQRNAALDVVNVLTPVLAAMTEKPPGGG